MIFKYVCILNSLYYYKVLIDLIDGNIFKI